MPTVGYANPLSLLDITVIPHHKQAYDTVGDWTVAPGPAFIVKVSDLKDWRYNLLVGLHEAIEAALCHQRSISEAAVTAFDKDYEAARTKGDLSEPGDSEKAPYHCEHVFATKIERLVAEELGVDWETYNAAVEDL